MYKDKGEWYYYDEMPDEQGNRRAISLDEDELETRYSPRYWMKWVERKNCFQAWNNGINHCQCGQSRCVINRFDNEAEND
jgi:hypothetical protein